MGSAQGYSAAELQLLYKDLNTKYFKGRLRRCKVRVDPTLPTFGRCSSKGGVIDLQPNDRQQQKQTLIHEKCHIGDRTHGRRFQKKLQAVADQGEPLAANELELLRGSPTWNRERSFWNSYDLSTVERLLSP